MSRHALGGDGRPPRDTNHPSRSSQSVQSVRRKLFGDVDHRQTSIDLEREVRQCEADDRNKYNFDFKSEQPINSSDSRYQWSQSNDINTPEDNVSTNVCKLRDIPKNTKNIVQSSTQSAMGCRPETELPYKAVSSALGSNSSQSPTPSATCAPDSQSQSSSSSVELTSKVGQEHKSVTHTKQKLITAYFDDRKSNQSQRKRSAANERETKTKRHRPSTLDQTTSRQCPNTSIIRPVPSNLPQPNQ